MDNEKKFAILIDAENISQEYIKVILDEITKEGIITYKRSYADWTKPTVSSWKKILLDYSIIPIQQYSYTQGKNSTDSAIIIDAMDILYSGNVDGFCIVSSDSDFTRLAARLREAGKIVIGMGTQITPKPLVSACSKFRYLDLLATDTDKTKIPTTNEQKTEESTLTNEEEIKKSIRLFIEENSNAEGWVLTSNLGMFMQKKYPDFDYRNYGCIKLIDLLKKFGYETKLSKDKKTYYVK